jgi:hypothetical protein
MPGCYCLNRVTKLFDAIVSRRRADGDDEHARDGY